MELIRTHMIFSSVEMWVGTGSCEFPGISVFDPWYRLPVKDFLAATHLVADFILPEGRVLETL